ncbi:MAG TPA: replicative DNA helicase, partial [bacterium]|nr:replicative DNA helicase [bacterium]
RTKESRVQEVSEISRFLKQIARELDIPVLALSQLSRAIEQRTDRTPQLSDLRESGTIEQDADIVMFLNREEMYNPETERKGVTDLTVAKHRNGPTGKVELFFVKEQARFKQLEKKPQK